MSWAELDKETRALVESVLTARELDAVKLHNAGYGTRMIAQSLGVDRSTIRDRLKSAERKILEAIEERSGAK